MNLSKLEEYYLSQVDLNLFKSADLQLRGLYWFCDVKLKTGGKLTHFKFTFESSAQEFLNLLYSEYYKSNDYTKLTWTDGLWIALFACLITVLYFLIF
jgi:hypothetical protein